MTDEQQIRAAVAAVRSARQGIHTAADRRAAAVAAARHLAEAAQAAERAEQDAARAAAAAGIHRLTAAQLAAPEIAALCGIPPDEVQHVRVAGATGQGPDHPHLDATGPGADTAR